MFQIRRRPAPTQLQETARQPPKNPPESKRQPGGVETVAKPLDG